MVDKEVELICEDVQNEFKKPNIWTPLTAKKRLVFLSFDDWEGIYIDGVLHHEGHELGEGDRFFYLLELSEEMNFCRADITFPEPMDALVEMVEDSGHLPNDLKDIVHLIDWE